MFESMPTLGCSAPFFDSFHAFFSTRSVNLLFKRLVEIVWLRKFHNAVRNELRFSNFGEQWFQTLVFQAFSSILLPWAWELLLWILTYVSQNTVKTQIFCKFLLLCSQMRVFEGGAKILGFGGLKSSQNPLKIHEHRSKKTYKKPMVF